LFELRTSLSSRREARVLFGVQAGQIRVVHAFMKKTRVTTAEDMALARQRLENWE
jgi:phage-related protein